MNCFYSVGRTPSERYLNSLFLSNECRINEFMKQPTEFHFYPIAKVPVQRAFSKINSSFGFGSVGLASSFIKIAFQ